VTGVDSASTRLTVPVSCGVGLEFIAESTVEFTIEFVFLFVLIVLFMVLLLLWSLLFGSFGFALRIALVRCAHVTAIAG
jgi:phosphoglycerol transferase MdoB-like AlkP superfamily enzyme